MKGLLDAANEDAREGDVYCLVSERWWREWNDYAGLERFTEYFAPFESSNQISLHSPCRPGKIDNSELVVNEANSDERADGSILRRDMQELQDYHLIPLEVWKKLHEWYGGGPELRRKLISAGPLYKNFIVEVYPLHLQLIDESNNSQHPIIMSKKALVGELHNFICSLLKRDKDEVRIWDFYNRRKYNLLENFDQTLEEANLMMDQEILLELKVDGDWPSSSDMDSTGNELALVTVEPSTSFNSIAGGPSMSNGGQSTRFGSHFLLGNDLSSEQHDANGGGDILSFGGKVNGRGLTGLQNLGNTCFMNSALQCLVHTPQLVDFFLQNYTEEINKENPLGMQGELAVAFGDLLRKLWSSGHNPVAPRVFKAKLGRFAPQFSGYNQHDSQELLAFLLDGLHEDLNRVKIKPYIEAKDADGRSDEEFADECWQNHKARNDSIIVDVCQGQYKSTLICPDCSKVSVTFDPFMYLSLPLPIAVTRKMTIMVISGEGSHLPMPCTVTVPKNGCCKDLVQALSIECCLSSNEVLLLAEVFNHKIFRYLENSFESLSNIKAEEHIVAYKLPLNHEKSLRIEILHRRSEGDVSDTEKNVLPQHIGTPLVTCLPVYSNAVADTQAAVAKVLAPLLRERSSPTHPKPNDDNPGEPSIDGVVPTDGTDSCEDVSTSDVEVEDASSAHPLFQLGLANSLGVNRSSFDSHSRLLSGPFTRVVLTWSEREFELYNFSLLENLPKVLDSTSMAKKSREEAPSLFSCLESFLKEEPLGPDDMWYCPGCKEHKQAIKKLDLWSLPDILVVHLKRFSYSRYLKNKLEFNVDFPLHNLDLSPYVKQKSGTKSYVYELYAVSNHYGGLGGGHYSAYAKLIDEDRWYNFDDSHVSPVGEDEIKTSAAYVLFYRRTETETDSMMAVDEPSNCLDPSSSQI